jgi:intraflagellar transport protein 52
VFPPTLREPAPPALDQFDLDEHFASESLRLAQLTNKCSDDDLEYYVKESADILGILPKLDAEKQDAKHILEFIFHKIVNFKKLNQDGPSGPVGNGHGTNGNGTTLGNPPPMKTDGGESRFDYDIESKASTP